MFACARIFSSHESVLVHGCSALSTALPYQHRKLDDANFGSQLLRTLPAPAPLWSPSCSEGCLLAPKCPGKTERIYFGVLACGDQASGRAERQEKTNICLCLSYFLLLLSVSAAPNDLSSIVASDESMHFPVIPAPTSRGVLYRNFLGAYRRSSNLLPTETTTVPHLLSSF